MDSTLICVSDLTFVVNGIMAEFQVTPISHNALPTFYTLVWMRNNYEGDIIFRDYSDPWMTQMANWMDYIVDYLNPLFASNGGPIIMAQVENEYGWLEKEYGKNGTRYAEWSAEYANNMNVSVPWIMCAQDDIDDVINTCNGFYCHDWLAGHWEKYPNQPGLWTESK